MTPLTRRSAAHNYRVPKKRKREPKARLIRKIRPEEPEARDEGPRLIPYDPPRLSDPALGLHSHYLELADQAIQGSKKKK